MAMRRSSAGHRPIVVVGGATALVGDPSGKSGPQDADPETVASNAAAIRTQLERSALGTGAPNDAILVNNADCLSLGYIEFLRDYGRHFTGTA